MCSRRVLHHHHRIRPRRQRSPRHDPHRLPAPHRARSRFRPVARLHLAHNFKARRNLRQVRRPHCISIASSTIKRRKVAIRHRPLRQHPPQPRQQIHRLHSSRRHASRMLLNQASGLFKAHHSSRRSYGGRKGMGRRRHARIIRRRILPSRKGETTGNCPIAPVPAPAPSHCWRSTGRFRDPPGPSGPVLRSRHRNAACLRFRWP